MKRIYLSLAFISIVTFSFSQDVITRTNGETINCKVTKIDSVRVFFKINDKGKQVFTNLKMSMVKNIDYGYTSLSSSNDSILMKKASGRFSGYYQGENKLNMEELVGIMGSNGEAYNEIMKAESNSTFATLLGYPGGFMIGYALGTRIRGGNPNWILAGIGAGLLIVAIPIVKSGDKHFENAVEIYNSGVEKTTFHHKNHLDLGLTQNGIGLTLRF